MLIKMINIYIINIIADDDTKIGLHEIAFLMIKGFFKVKKKNGIAKKKRHFLSGIIDVVVLTFKDDIFRSNFLRSTGDVAILLLLYFDFIIELWNIFLFLRSIHIAY